VIPLQIGLLFLFAIVAARSAMVAWNRR